MGCGIAAAAVLTLTNSDDLRRWFGPVPAVVGVAVIGVVGYAMLRFLRSRGFWADSGEAWRPGTFPIAIAASVPFALIAITVDSVFGFSEDLNVEWPASVLFYLMITLVAEVIFHLLPVAALVLVSSSQWSDRTFDTRSLRVIGVAALAEPTFQIIADPTLAAFVFPHVYLIGVTQLSLLRRFGYISMVAFRLSYYLLWHVLWGVARLELLF